MQWNMHKSCYQTVEVYYPNSTTKFLAMKTSPPTIYGMCDTCGVSEEQQDGSTIYWFHDRSEIHYDDGTKEIYRKRPTLKSIITSPVKGQYARFHKDGTVEVTVNGESYRWGPDFPVYWDMSNMVDACMCLYCDEPPACSECTVPYCNGGCAFDMDDEY